MPTEVDLVSLISTINNEVEVLSSSIEVASLVHLTLLSRSVTIISPTGAIVTITGLGMNMSLGLNM